MAERLPSVHIPSEPSRDTKSKVGMREVLVSSRTASINVVRGWLRAEARLPRTGTAETFGKRVRELATTMGFALPVHVERQLRTIEFLSAQIAEEDREIERAAKAEPRCQLLQTVPGIGALTSMLFVAVLDEVGRFPNAHMFESYLGLVPGEDSSSERERRTRITKAGSSALRRLLVQSAHTMRRCRPADPVVLWSHQVEKRRGKKAAVVALARKMAGIAWAMLRDGTPYAPERAARPPAEPPDAESMRQALALLSSPPPSRRSRPSRSPSRKQ
jgi:transposase